MADKEKDLERAKAMLAKAVDLGASEEEAFSSLRQVRKLLARHSASQGDVIGSQSGPRAAVPSVAEVAAAGASAVATVGEVVDKVRSVANDPNVQTIFSGIGEVFRAASNMVDKAAAAKRNGAHR